MATFPLGRVVDHDPRSFAFPAPRVRTIAPKAVLHRTYGAVLDQGHVGSCVGNASAAALNTRSLHKARAKMLTEDDAVAIYSAATLIDGNGYPPQDTGTSALSAAKALRTMGKITSWSTAFGLQHVLDALALKPVLLGINWYESMFTPDASGRLSVSGAIAGGHETLIRGMDPASKTVRVRNSWGQDWGLKGDYLLSYADLDRLLSERGDATVFVV